MDLTQVTGQLAHKRNVRIQSVFAINHLERWQKLLVGSTPALQQSLQTLLNYVRRLHRYYQQVLYDAYSPEALLDMPHFVLILLLVCFHCSGSESLRGDSSFSAEQAGRAGHTHVFKESIPLLESRNDLVRHGRIRNDYHHDVIFVIKQKNMDELLSILHDVSDPRSRKYGQHLKREEIVDMTYNAEAIDAVTSYLYSTGATITSQTLGGEYITATASISIWEDIFRTEFYTFHQTHRDESIEKLIRTEKYHLPRVLDEHVECVLNIIDVPDRVFYKKKKLRRVPETTDRGRNSKSLQVDGYLAPDDIRTYYNMSLTTQGSAASGMAVFESNGQTYSPSDLATFQSRYVTGFPLQPVTTVMNNMVNDTLCALNPNICGESMLDLEYMMAMSPVSPMTFWYTYNYFNDWLVEVANTPNPPLVLSISYGSTESYVSSGTHDSFTTAAIKLGVMGVTVIASSGDDGANDWSVRYNGASSCGYTPLFPCANPYVTAVGATSVSQRCSSSQRPTSGTCKFKPTSLFIFITNFEFLSVNFVYL